MCKCNPEIKTPFCGKPGCEWPFGTPAHFRSDRAPPSSNLRVLPCPFCGSPGEESEHWRAHFGCTNAACGAYKANLTLPNWNMRPAVETNGELDELRSIIEIRCCVGSTLAEKLRHALNCRDAWSEQLNADAAKHEKEMTQELEARDRNADYADQLTYMISVLLDQEMGEHSNLNDPWENAIEAMRVAIGTKQSAVKTGAPRCEAQSPGFFSKRCDLSHGHDGSHVATKDGVTDKWPSNPPLCPTCKTELAFEGDVCGLCFPVAQP
jgi:hypothetical protein